MLHDPISLLLQVKLLLRGLVTFWDSFNSAIHPNLSLSSVYKFKYLKSLVELFTAQAIAGLTITSANYDEAIATLKKRFSNTQLTVINWHMETLFLLFPHPSI